MSEVLLDSPTVELEVELETEIKQYPVIPNPPGEATEDIEKIGIDGIVYNPYDVSIPSFVRDIPALPDDTGYYTLDLVKTNSGYAFNWRRLAIPADSLYPSDVE